MIRIGENKDVEQGVKLLEQHRKEFDFGQFKEDNTEYYKGLMEAIAKDKTAIISENNGIIDGVLLGMKIPNLLNPHITQLHVLLTWVHPNKRGSSIFYRMNKIHLLILPALLLHLFCLHCLNIQLSLRCFLLKILW